MKTIEMIGIKKKYGQKEVLSGVDLTLVPGVTGLLGPNGAGKTTLIRCLLDLIPYEGKIRWEGGVPSIGYLPQDFRIFQRLTVREALLYVAELKNEKPDTVETAMEITELQKEANKKVRELSGGMLRRLGIAQALLGDPAMLVLDEPTVGLDPMQRVKTRNLIARIAKDRIVLLSTHIVEDIEQIATHVVILNEGKVEVQGDVQPMIQALEGKIGVIELSEIESDRTEDSLKILQVQSDGVRQTATVYADRLPKKARRTVPTLEDVYLRYVDPHDS